MVSRTALFLLILLIATIGGLNPILAKIVLKEIPPLSFNFFRFLFAALSFTPIFIKEGSYQKIKDKSLFLLTLLAIVNMILFAFGVQLTSATSSQILYNLTPLLAAIFGFIIFKDELSLIKSLGVGLGLLGAILVILKPDAGLNLGDTLRGEIIIFIAVVFFSTYTGLSQHFHKRYSSKQLTFALILYSVITFFFLAFFDLIQNPFWWKGVSLKAILIMIYMGALGTTIYYFFYQYLIKRAGAVTAASVIYLQPLITYFFASIILGEKLSMGMFVGGILVLLGVWLTTSNKK